MPANRRRGEQAKRRTEKEGEERTRSATRDINRGAGCDKLTFLKEAGLLDSSRTRAEKQLLLHTRGLSPENVFFRPESFEHLVLPLDLSVEYSVTSRIHVRRPLTHSP